MGESRSGAFLKEVRKAQGATLDRIVALHLDGLPMAEKEYRFHDVRQWRFDYAWPGHQVALEVHGGAFSGGRHTTGTGFTKDCEKMSTAASMGWLVITVTTEQLKKGMARAWVKGALIQHGAEL